VRLQHTSLTLSFICPFTLFRSLFKKCPEAQVLFGFPLDLYPDPRELVNSMRFKMHATFLMEMIDSTISILGKDNEKLAQTLTDLGKKHATYGVKPEYFPFMTESIIAMMQDHLGDQFTKGDEKAWEKVFAALIEDIIDAQNKCALEEAAKNKAAVIDTWTEFQNTTNKWEEVGGVILFQQ